MIYCKWDMDQFFGKCLFRQKKRLKTSEHGAEVWVFLVMFGVYLPSWAELQQ